MAPVLVVALAVVVAEIIGEVLAEVAGLVLEMVLARAGLTEKTQKTENSHRTG